MLPLETCEVRINRPRPRTRFRNRFQTAAASTRPSERADRSERIPDRPDPFPQSRRHRREPHAPLRPAPVMNRRTPACAHVRKNGSDLISDGPMKPLASLRINRNHARQKYIVADADARDVRQVGVARRVEMGISWLDCRTSKFLRHRGHASAVHSMMTFAPRGRRAPHTVRAGGATGKNRA